MKALLILTLISSLASLASGKVENFNSLINEDSKAQKELHSKIKSQVYTQNELEMRQNYGRGKKQYNRSSIVVLDDGQSTYAAPTNDKVFRFKKEVKQKSTNLEKINTESLKRLKSWAYRAAWAASKNPDPESASDIGQSIRNGQLKEIRRQLSIAKEALFLGS